MKNLMVVIFPFLKKKRKGTDNQDLQPTMVGLILWIVFVISILSGTIMFFNAMRSYWSIYLLGGVCFTGWLINRAGHEKTSAILLVVAILVTLQFNILNGLGIHDVAIVAWPAMILFAGLLFGSRLIPYFTVLVSLLAIATKYLPNGEGFTGTADTSDLVIMLVILVTVGLIARYVIRRGETTVQQLRQSEERAQAIFNSVNDAIFIHDAQTGEILDVNNKVLEMFGYAHEEAFQLNVGAISLGVPPYEKQYVMNWLKKASAEGPQRFERLVKDKAGRLFWVDVNMRLAAISEHSQIVMSVRDITERKQAEEAIHTLNAELEQRVVSRTTALEAANKELEAFAYSVSHDLRTPLRSINGFSNILLADHQGQLDLEGQEYLVRIQEASQRMGHLIDDLLTLSRITRAELTRQEVDLSALAIETAAGLRNQAPLRQVEFQIADNLVVNGDPHLLKIVLENLLSNAFKFTGHTPQAKILVGVSEHIYFVRDNGAGFDMAYADKLFVPFQRLHGMQEFSGTGIGLATVQRIISRHGGRIWAEAEVDRGATFFFTLGEG